MLRKLSTWSCLEMKMQGRITIWRLIINPLKGWSSSNIWERHKFSCVIAHRSNWKTARATFLSIGTFIFLLLLSALQLFVSFGLPNYFFPFLSLLLPLFPIIRSHLPQIIPHIVFPSYSWSSLRSFCIRFPFVYGLGHSFIGHSFYMPRPAQSFVFYVSYYIFIINCFFQFFNCFESPLSVCLLCWAKYR